MDWTTVTPFQWVSIGIASVGATLGVVNLVRDLLRNRFRAIVRLRFAYMADHSGKVEKVARLAIEVINQNPFAITISEVGFCEKAGTKSVMQAPMMADGGAFPRRLEARAAFSVYTIPKPFTKAELEKLDCAFAKSDCEHVVKDKSSRKALKRYAASMKA